MRRILFRLPLLAAIAYLACCVLLFVGQRSLIYFPPAGEPFHPANILRLNTAVGDVLVTHREREGEAAILYFGGNAEDVSMNLPEFTEAFPQHALYLLHYRGYGGSAGSPSEKAIVDDGLALFDRIYRQHRQVVVIGRSLGSGVAMQIASQRPVDRLVLVTPYDSLVNIARRQFPYMPVNWLLADRYESWHHAATVTAPTLLVAADRDNVIPAASTAALLGAFKPGQATLVVLPDTDHNSIADHPRYLPLLVNGK